MRRSRVCGNGGQATSCPRTWTAYLTWGLAVVVPDDDYTDSNRVVVDVDNPRCGLVGYLVIIGMPG